MKRKIKICKHCLKYIKKDKVSIAWGGARGGARIMNGHRCVAKYTLNSYMAKKTFEDWEISPECEMPLEYLLVGKKI